MQFCWLIIFFAAQIFPSSWLSLSWLCNHVLSFPGSPIIGSLLGLLVPYVVSFFDFFSFPTERPKIRNRIQQRGMAFQDACEPHFKLQQSEYSDLNPRPDKCSEKVNETQEPHLILFSWNPECYYWNWFLETQCPHQKLQGILRATFLSAKISLADASDSACDASRSIFQSEVELVSHQNWSIAD